MGLDLLTSPKGKTIMEKQITKKIFEVTFIINATLEDPQIDSEIEKVKDLIVKQGGEIIELTKWGRKRFSYPIKKKNNGFYVICLFSAPGNIVARLERHFLLNENILRFLVLKMDKRELKGRISGADVISQATAAPATSDHLISSESAIEEDDLDVPFNEHNEL